MTEATIPVVECFGPTIQGEGPFIGTQVLFVRTARCDSRCVWCDSKFTWDVMSGKPMSVAEIIDELRNLSGYRLDRYEVVVSGGNPALHDSVGALARALRDMGVGVHLETQGTVAKEWFSDLKHLALSPKGPSSGCPTPLEQVGKCFSAGIHTAHLTIKIVVADDRDYRYARRVSKMFNDQLPIYLQPCNPDQVGDIQLEAKIELLGGLAQKCLDDRFSNAVILPQLHNLMWGNKRGV